MTASTSSTNSDDGIRTLGDQMISLANDYISGQLDLRALDRFIHSYVDEFLALDNTDHPGAPLSAFIQVRIYQMDDGLAEEAVRSELATYLHDQQLDRARPERAIG